MEAIEFYRLYKAMRLHFTTEKYDITKTHGAVKVSRESFEKRHDLYFITKLASKFQKRDAIEFLLSNLVTGDFSAGIFGSEANDIYTRWKGKQSRLLYDFESEVKQLYRVAEKRNIDDIYDCSNGHPLIIKQYLSKDLSLETLVSINKLEPFVELLDKHLAGDMVWPEVRRLLTKYSPFIKIRTEREKYARILEAARKDFQSNRNGDGLYQKGHGNDSEQYQRDTRNNSGHAETSGSISSCAEESSTSNEPLAIFD